MTRITIHETLDLDAARSLALALDADDAPGSAPTAAALRLVDLPSLSGEDTGAIQFTDLLASEFHPVPPQDRIEHPWLSAVALDDAAEELTSRLPVSRGRHNRYRPVPGEDALRTDDLVDFVKWYGHEYQILVFRAADVRTAGLLELAPLLAAADAVRASVMLDWTGATDWLPAPPAEGVAAVFWSTHQSLLDGRSIEAGVWRPDDAASIAVPLGPSLSPATLERTQRRAGLVAPALAAVADLRVIPPDGALSRLPLLMFEAPDATATADTLAAGPGFRSVICYGERVVALPDADAAYADIVERVAAVVSRYGPAPGASIDMRS